MKHLKLSIMLIAAAIFVGACGQAANTPVSNNTAPKSNQTATTPTAPVNAAPDAEVASGKELYALNCMICHKENGKGGKVTVEGKSIDPDDITTDKMKAKADDKFVGYINEGFPDDGMPAFKGKLTDEQIKAVVKHVRSLQGS